eukprot:6571238-Prymnesium_polylepis.1
MRDDLEKANSNSSSALHVSDWPNGGSTGVTITLVVALLAFLSVALLCLRRRGCRSSRGGRAKLYDGAVTSTAFESDRLSRCGPPRSPAKQIKSMGLPREHVQNIFSGPQSCDLHIERL